MHIPTARSMAATSIWAQVSDHVRISDVAVAMLCLFLSSAAVHRLTTKGPMNWPVFGILPTLFFNIHNVHDWATDAANRCGGTFSYRSMWFSRTFGILTVDPLKLEHILKTRFANFPKGRYYRERFADLLGEGIFNADDQAWREQRRAATAEMHSARFGGYSAETIRDLVHRKLLVLLDRLAVAGRTVDLQDVLLRFTFDNICKAAFGVDPGCLAVDLPEVPFARAFEQATELTMFRFTVPYFVWRPMRRLNLGPESRLKEAVRKVHEFARKTVSDRRAESREICRERSDLLSRLMVVEAEEGDGKLRGFSDQFLKDFCISFILAGRDTSSVALAWFFWLLHKHPRVEGRILDEIARIVKRRGLVPAGGGEVVFTVEELKGMEYLQAALSESLRLYPSVPLDFKEAVEDDVFPDGTRVRKGTRVVYSIYSMGRTEGIWGKDCREFRPERWLRDGVFVNESPFKYAVFNAGPRLCVGKKFAYMQMKMVAASILLRYQVVVAEGQVVVPKLATTLYMRNGLRVAFKPRE